MLHDTHGHLELLLEKLEILPHNTRDLTDLTLDSAQQIYLNNLLKEHDFFVQAGLCTPNFRLAQSLFSSTAKIFFLLGTHPEIVDATFDVADYLQKQEEFLQLHPTLFIDPAYRTIGIGEIGLDYYHATDLTIHKKQQQVFRAQIELAITHHQPIQIHTRNAFCDTLNILKEYPEIHGRFEIHCYSEGIDELRSVLDLGGMIGIGGVSTYKNAENVMAAAVFCPLDSFVFETDLPFLAPPPYRGKTCLPQYISLIADNLAQLKATSSDRLWEHSAHNFAQMFDTSAKVITKK